MRQRQVGLKAEAEARSSLHKSEALLLKGPQESTPLVTLEAAGVTQTRP